jgi:ferritin-like protein
MSEQAATPEEIEERVNMAFTLLMKGFSQREIVDYFHTKTDWGPSLSKRWLREYVARAREELSKMAAGDIDRREQFSMAVQRLNEQYRKANQMNDTARSIQAVQALVSLLKLDQPAAAMDWRKEAEKAGIDHAALFEQLVKAAADVNQ